MSFLKDSSITTIKAYQQIFKALPGNYIVLAADPPNFTICDISDKYLEATAKKREDIINKSLFDIVSDNIADRKNSIYDSFLEIISAGKETECGMIRYDIVVREESGKKHWNPAYMPVKDTNGAVTHIVLSLIEISCKGHSDDSEYLDTALEAADIGRWDYNPKTGELLWNRQFFGSLETVPVDHNIFRSAIHPDDLPKVDEAITEAYTGKNNGNYEIEYRSIGITDKKLRWIKAKGKVFFDAGGNPERFIGTAIDITDLKQLIVTLQKNEILFRSISTASPVALFIRDAKGNTLFLNEIWSRWTGKPLESQLNWGWLESISEEDRERTLKTFTAALKKRKRFEIEYRVRHLTGKERWCLAVGSPYYKDGEFAGYAGSITDIHERKKEELRKNDFIAMASHELKTPLTSIKGYIQILRKKNPGLLHGNLLNKANNQVNKMTKLISDFLNLSKMESGKFILWPVTFNLNNLIDEILTDVEPLSDTHRFVFEKGPDINIHADREKIGQVMINFIDNACKYSPGDTTITINTIFQNGKVTVRVKDEGIGVSAEEARKIFQRFYRTETDERNKFTGFGIGLYLSAEIIRRHRGRIGVASKPGEGSTFYFSLPAAAHLSTVQC